MAEKATVALKTGSGDVIREFSTFALRESFTDPLGSFDLTLALPRHRVAYYRELLRKGTIVGLSVNDTPQTSCIIQTTTLTVDRGAGVELRLECMSPLVTAYQGSVDPLLNFQSQADAPVGDIVLKALSPYGFDTFVGDTHASVNVKSGKPIAGGRAPIVIDALKIQDAQAHENETAYKFVARIITRLGLMLRCAPDGTLLVSAPDYGQEVAYALACDTSGQAAGDRFVGRVIVTDTNDDQFSECQVRGQRAHAKGTTSTAKPKGTVTSGELATTHATYRSKAANYKPLIISDKNSRDVERARSAATLAMGLRATKAFQVRGSVHGFVSQTGRIWTIDTIAHAVVDHADIDEDMWILERTLRQDRQGGQMTDLTLIPKGALVLGELPAGA